MLMHDTSAVREAWETIVTYAPEVAAHHVSVAASFRT